MQGLISVREYVGGRGCPLFVPVSSGNVTRRGTSLAASAVEDNLLGFSWLVKAVLATESLSIQVQGVGEHRKWEVHGRGDGPLHHFVGFPDINQVGILGESLEIADAVENARPYITRTEGFWLELLIGENGALPVLLQFVIEFTSSFESLFVVGFGGLMPSE